MKRKGIILAGGTGKRLYPITKVINKQLLPLYNKPMIFYPLTTLMLAGIKEILIVTTKSAIDSFKSLLGDGHHLGIKITYALQDSADGVAQSILISEDHINNNNVALILGDNIFYGNRLFPLLMEKNYESKYGATLFAQKVKKPQQFGVVEFSSDGEIISIEEKPKKPKSDYAITGLYFYDNTVVDKAKKVKLSTRGEYEINDINIQYLKENKLEVKIMNRGIAWLDTGTYESISEASDYIKALENIQGLKIGCPEEVSWRLGLITREQLFQLANSYDGSEYGQYLLRLSEIDNKDF